MTDINVSVPSASSYWLKYISIGDKYDPAELQGNASVYESKDGKVQVLSLSSKKVSSWHNVFVSVDSGETFYQLYKDPLKGSKKISFPFTTQFITMSNSGGKPLECSNGKAPELTQVPGDKSKSIVEKTSLIALPTVLFTSGAALLCGQETYFVATPPYFGNKLVKVSEVFNGTRIFKAAKDATLNEMVIKSTTYIAPSTSSDPNYYQFETDDGVFKFSLEGSSGFYLNEDKCVDKSLDNKFISKYAPYFPDYKGMYEAVCGDK